MRAIFITGGASGIGLAIAQRFAREGWRVGLADVNDGGLKAAAAGLPGNPLSYVMDVRARDQWEASLSHFTRETGRLDVLANNAGIAAGGVLAEADWAEIDRVIAINFIGVLNGAKIGFPYLKATPGSVLMNTASASAIYGTPGLVPYSATKFAVRAITEGLDAEWAPEGVKVRGLVPAFIDTPLLAPAAHGSNQSMREAVTNAGLELSSAEEVAEAAWKLVHGDELFGYIGATARKLKFAARWMPGGLRKSLRKRGLVRAEG